MLIKSKPFQVTLWIFIIFITVWIGQQISFVFHPLVVLVKTIFFPVLIAGILYYLTNSIVDWLVDRKLPRLAAIFLIFLLFVLILLFAILYISPILEHQLTSLVNNLPGFINQLDKQFQEFQESTIFAQIEQFEFFQTLSNIDYVKVVDRVVATISQNIVSFLGSVANFVIVLFTIPFILFFMLKDGKKLIPHVMAIIPVQYKNEVQEVLADLNETIRSYIQGILTVCLFVGVFVYIGYLIIGLDYALLLAAVALVTNIIPYFGPVIGIIPGVIVGLISSPLTAIEVVVMVFIVQQVESQLVGPLVIGKKLKIHPVTIIVLLLTAGSLGGLLAIILAVPTYAIGKVIIVHAVAFIRKIKTVDL